ncbi:MAG: DUF1963 domain-containing protein [Acidobacteria bacterium]|nr:DUF1963 domain-containing protein [Acidobacteriota bacterium]
MWNIIRLIFGRQMKTSSPTRDLGAITTPLERAALHVVRSDTPTKSQLGGDPGLPTDIAWPHRGDARLRFLARLSLTELQATEATPWLPQSGALLFFYDDDEQPWGFDPVDRGGWAVLHVPDISAETPSQASEPESSSLLPFSSVAFRQIRVLPSADRPEVHGMKFSGDEFDKYLELADRRFGGLPKHQMLGFPSPVQGDSMELECQLASNGVYCGNPEGYATERAKQLESGAQKWRLLFQLDSDDELGVMWGDAGLLYYWVEEAAARKGDFSNVWLVLQCG